MIHYAVIAGMVATAPVFCASGESGGANPGDGGATASAKVAGSPSIDSISGISDIRNVLEHFQSVIEQQSRELEEQRIEIREQRKQLEILRGQLEANKDTPSDPMAPAADLHAAVSAMALDSTSVSPAFVRAAAVKPPAAQAVPANPEGESPLYIKIGNAKFTPGGWADFTTIYRTTDVGTGTATSFASIPFNNTVQGGLTETRFSSQSSRLSLRADESFGNTRIFGYAEADFNGYLPSTAYVSTNGSSLRLRVFFLNISRGRWDLLGGQSWSLLTPNRVGLSPFLSEIFNTLHLDTNYQVGLTYARQPQLRAVYHPKENIALGLSIENPEQLSGNGVTFPSLFNTAEADVNSSTGAGGNTATPNLHPDVIAKIAADKKLAGRSWHLEAAGLFTGIRVYTPASVTKGAAYTDVREGGGASANVNLELVKGFHLIADSFWSDGGGRYIGALGPAFVVSQDGSPQQPFLAHLVHSGSGLGGFEWQATKSTIVSAYYSGAYFQRLSSFDPSTKTTVGYGFNGSANSNNRAIQEGTVSSVTTLWRRPSYGTLQLITQSSYVTRAPWYVALGAPKNAHAFMEYTNIRYVLP